MGVVNALFPRPQFRDHYAGKMMKEKFSIFHITFVICHRRKIGSGDDK
jgi:hypothetical protein